MNDIATDHLFNLSNFIIHIYHKIHSVCVRFVICALSFLNRIRKTADVVLPLCNPDAKVVSGQFDVDFSSSAQFFCFIGVMSFLFLLLLIPGYVFLGSFFNKNSLPAKVVCEYF